MSDPDWAPPRAAGAISVGGQTSTAIFRGIGTDEEGEPMRQRIGLGQLRNSAAYYFDRVADGETFDVIRRGQAVARIVPLSMAADGDSEPGETAALARMAGTTHRTADGSVHSNAPIGDLDVE